MLPNADERPTVTVDEVATAFGVHPKTIRKGVERDEIPGVIRCGRRVLFATAVIRRHLGLDDRSATPPPMAVSSFAWDRDAQHVP